MNNNNCFGSYSEKEKLPNVISRFLITAISAAGYFGVLALLFISRNKLPVGFSILDAILMGPVPVFISYLGLKLIESKVSNGFCGAILANLSLISIGAFSFIVFSAINHLFFGYGFGGEIKIEGGFFGSSLMFIEGVVGVIYFFWHAIILFQTFFGKID